MDRMLEGPIYRPRSKVPGWLILVGLATLTSCGAKPPPVASVVQDDHFVLRIAGDGALALNDKPIAREDVAAEAVRLAGRARVAARLAGKTVDPALGVPAVMSVEAAGELPCSAIYSLVIDCQLAGFRTWSFVLDTDDPGTRPKPRGGPMPSVVVGTPDDGLAVELRTLPIRLEADEMGMLSHLKLDDREFPSIEALKVEIAEILVDPDLRFDRALLKADERLQYAELLRVFKMLSDLKVDKIDVTLIRSENSR